MATIYDAEISPSKSELLIQWLPAQPWFVGDAAALVRLGAFRFDDPAGEVGLETIVVGVGGRTYQVPLSYRGAPLAGAEDFLITTMEHSVLGQRWVYDATADPVYVRELAAALLAGKPQAAQNVVVGNALESLPETAWLSSTGTPDVELPELNVGAPRTSAGVTRIPAGPLNFDVVRELELEEFDTSATIARAAELTLAWAGRQVPVVIAAAFTA